ncbi:alpha/beta-hydrolase family protein [Corynebacterium striatum]|uniref:alpha/beta-hydrolase family protein n=1 Tax=Corynebacterium striatum TaxID=43770 RepID=UPI003B5C8568|nr:alpha/beta-hydrolase family protein [Corynebacterium striatum]HCD1825836.1 alpha/beta-hydrolase family protein [Corynebacterium striatum]HCD2182347.1 alpha/beta-hydrolase family protein [Corynebacterium striatum]HCD2851643.1 alpha/beta-hydrolase family protein [Corynebacterium striatum]HCD3732117.1 alpha/beta-hydrolase family protein [Corynebacterium striatum]
MVRMRDIARKFARTAAIHTLSAAAFGLEVLSDLTPGVRMTGRRRLPQNMAPGIFAAEIATWAAVSPSLLPRPWWVTAANVAIGQGLGHLAATTAAFITKRGLRYIGKRPQDHVGPTLRSRTHLALGAITLAVGVRSLRNQSAQAKLVNKHNERGPESAFLGIALGTVGYGTLLIVGEAAQITVTQLSRGVQRWLPRWVAWPLAGAAVSYAAAFLSNRMLWRRFIHDASLKALQLNKLVYPGSVMPWEPERSGSPWSLEPWTAVGSQGRAFLDRGPRAHDIKEVMICNRAHEPIRIFVGLVQGRGPISAAQQALAELERTGAFRRETIVIQLPAGSGWINNYSVSAYEFLTHGNCATVTLQYSYLPSVFCYVVDRQAPVDAARELINAVQSRLSTLPEDDRPKLYFAGESLGCYGIVENYRDLDDLLQSCDGAVFTGPPRMTTFTRRLARGRDRGSLERLPLIDAGKHVRFASTPAHMEHDAFGSEYERWHRPRVVFGQHASDAIVWWDRRLIFMRPDWIHEPAPNTLYADTFKRLPWVPFITFWQVALDQLNSLNVPGGHGHNYFEETFWYWDCVLGSQARTQLTPELAERMRVFVERDQLNKPSDFRNQVRKRF